MRSHNRFHAAAIYLAVLFTVNTAYSGTNEGFQASVRGTLKINNPAIDDLIDVPVEVLQTTAVKGGLIRLQYDPKYLLYDGFEPGGFLPGALTLPQDPTTDENGLNSVEAGLTLFSAANDGGSGLLGTLKFKVIDTTPLEGTFISILAVQVQSSSQDVDLIEFSPGELGISLIRSFPNKISDIQITPADIQADITWRSKIPSNINQITYSPLGSTDEPLTATREISATQRHLEAIKYLRAQHIPLNEPEAVRAAITQSDLDINLPDDFYKNVVTINAALKNHRVILADLEPNTEYEISINSTGIGGELSQSISTVFSTRSEPDLRPLEVSGLDIQVGLNSITVRYQTNREADTRFSLLRDKNVVQEDQTTDSEGTTSHFLVFKDLEPNTEYDLNLSSRLVNVNALIEANRLTEDDATVVFNRVLRTKKRAKPLRLNQPPIEIVSAENINIVFLTNKPAQVVIDYGKVDPSSAEKIYTDQVINENYIASHNIRLEDNIESSTTYRYRITASTADGQTLTTDPSGNKQWSKDRKAKTSAAADNNPPTVISGPQATVLSNSKVLIKWNTDVPTTGVVKYGTIGQEGTFATANEYEKIDKRDDGVPRFRRRHRVILHGLGQGQEFAYRLESTAANGLVDIFNPATSAAAAKLAKIAKTMQPPGSLGTFITSNFSDTQYPVILSGPTITARTHELAVIEWDTDEPADSEALYGTATLDDSTTFGDVEVTHRLVLDELESNTTYEYLIGSTDATGNGATRSAKAIFTTAPEVDLTPPIIATDPSVIYVSDDNATIRWDTDEDATREISYGTNIEELNFIRTLLTTGKSHQISLTNLDPGTTYYFTVASTDLSNNGPTVSDTLQFTTDAAQDLTSPTISNIQTSTSLSSAYINWATDEIADSYINYSSNFSLTSNEGSTFAQTEESLVSVGSIEDVQQHELTLTNLEPGTTYTLTLGSTDPAGNPTISTEEISITTLSEQDLTPPAIPQNLVTTEGSEQVILSWLANTDAIDLAGYNLYRRIQGNTIFAPIASGLVDTSFIDLGLENGITYVYCLTASDRSSPPNESDISSLATVTPIGTAAPSAPDGLRLEESSADSLRPIFTFDNATSFNNAATLNYTIQVSTQADFSDVTGVISNLAEDSEGRTSWQIDRDLTKDVTYYWRVRAIEGILNSPFSATQEFDFLKTIVALAGDFNDDKIVDFGDFFLFVEAFGLPVDDSTNKFDMNSDNLIDFADFFAFVESFGNTASNKRWASIETIDSEATINLAAIGGNKTVNDGKITVTINAEKIEALKAYGLVMRYNHHSVEFQHATPGDNPFFGGTGQNETSLFQILSDSPGELVLGNGLIASTPVAGNGTLAHLHFRLIGSANEAYFQLAETYLASPNQAPRRVAQVQSVGLTPQAYYLSNNFPNPFNPSTSIEYALPETGPVRLTIYDILGRQVRTLVNKPNHPMGYHTITWDSKDKAGSLVGSGVYFYRLETPNFARVQKMTLIK